MNNTNKLFETNGIYYSDGYLPYRYFSVSKRLAELSRTMWGYKDGRNQYFDNIVEDAIMKLADKTNTRRIALVVVPSSKTNKTNALVGTVDRIIGRLNSYAIFALKQNRLFNYYNETDLLKRTTDLLSQCKDGVRYSVSELKAATTLNGRIQNDTTYIILDDVTTAGSSLTAAREILIENGAKPENVLTYAILKTRYTELDYSGIELG